MHNYILCSGSAQHSPIRRFGHLEVGTRQVPGDFQYFMRLRGPYLYEFWESPHVPGNLSGYFFDDLFEILIFRIMGERFTVGIGGVAEPDNNLDGLVEGRYERAF